VSLRRAVGVGEQARFLRYLAEIETMESMAGQMRFYQPIPHGMFDDD
jgi:hypothetical protein